MKRLFAIILALACALAGGCAGGETELTQIPEAQFPAAAAAGAPESADTVITLNANSADIVGEGARVADTEIIISKAGGYLLTGEWRGTLIIDVAEEKKVVIYLNGVNIEGDAGAAVWVKREPKNVTFFLCKDSINLMEDAEVYAYDETLEDIPSAALYSKEDLKFKGEGALYVTSRAGKGIQSKDDIEIEGGEIYVKALDDGIRGKDSVVISGGRVYIDAGADGIRASNEEDAEKGYIEISGGEVYVKSGQDGVQAITKLTISGGALAVHSGGGSANASTGATAGDWGAWGGKGGSRGGDRFGQKQQQQTTAADSVSAKGLKADDIIIITGGSISIDSSDDAIHSNNEILAQGGDILISSGDDGMHADNKLDISGGNIDILKSYEGIESADLRISGGNIRLTASDDGLNAAGGADLSSVSGRAGQNWGRGMMDSSSGSITFTGGYVCVNASGDGIDANGSVTMTGGTVIVYGPTNSGNGALDYSGAFDLSGGTLLAVGSRGMAQSVTGNGVNVIAFTCQMNADTLLSIADENGGEVLTFAAPKSYSCVVYASAALAAGTYDIYAQGAHTGTPADGIYAGGEYAPGTKLGALTIN